MPLSAQSNFRACLIKLMLLRLWTLWTLWTGALFPRFSGRRDGPFEVWLDEYHDSMPEPWHYAQRRKLEAHNRQMRYMYKHPARFSGNNLIGQEATNNVAR